MVMHITSISDIYIVIILFIHRWHIIDIDWHIINITHMLTHDWIMSTYPPYSIIHHWIDRMSLYLLLRITRHDLIMQIRNGWIKSGVSHPVWIMLSGCVVELWTFIVVILHDVCLRVDMRYVGAWIFDLCFEVIDMFFNFVEVVTWFFSVGCYDASELFFKCDIDLVVFSITFIKSSFF